MREALDHNENELIIHEWSENYRKNIQDLVNLSVDKTCFNFIVVYNLDFHKKTINYIFSN